MTTTVKEKATTAVKKTDARHKIKPRGLRGMFKDRIILYGTDEEVFNLGLQ